MSPNAPSASDAPENEPKVFDASGAMDTTVSISGIEGRLADSLGRRASDVDGTRAAPPVARVMDRSRQLGARRQALRGAVSVAAVLVVLALLLVPRTGDRPGGDVAGGSDATGRGGVAGVDGPRGDGAGRAAPNLALASSLQPFGSCDDFFGWVRTEAKKRVGPFGFTSRDSSGSGGGFVEDSFSSGRGGARSDREQSENQSRLSPLDQSQTRYATSPVDEASVSGTNTEEVGVDEPDIIKADPRRVITLLNGVLTTYSLDGVTPRLAGSVKLPTFDSSSMSPVRGGDPSAELSLLLAGDRAVVLSEAYVASGPPPGQADRSSGASSYYGRQVRTTILTGVDLTDLAAPKLTETVHITGSYVSARVVGGKARVVVSSDTATDLPFLYPSISGDKASEDAAVAANQRVIDNAGIERWVPTYRTGSALTTEVLAKPPTPLVDCANARHPTEFAGFGMVSVVSLDVAAGSVTPVDTVGVVATADKVYATPEHLYMSTTRVAAPEYDGTTPGTTVGTVLPGPSTPNPAESVRTAIHKFAVPVSGRPEYRASGELTGVLLNDFALSEHDGVLRAATTHASLYGTTMAESYVTTFREDGGALKQLGQVGGLGRNEQIQSVRFVGTVGYVVTFRQIDPLYTIDLADPVSPKVAGELKLLGYSAYLHPVGPGRLLGIGQDATAQGQTLGTKISLFDVADPATPKELSTTTVPMSSSIVEQDYRAFLWWGPTSLAMVPVRQAVGTDPLVGAIGFRIEADAPAAAEVGRVVNPIMGLWCPPGVGCVVPGGVTCAANGECPPPENPIGDPILRSVVVGDGVLTLSAGGLQASSLATLAPRAWVPNRPSI